MIGIFSAVATVIIFAVAAYLIGWAHGHTEATKEATERFKQAIKAGQSGVRL